MKIIAPPPYDTRPGSIGEYVPGQCPYCRLTGRFHEVYVCRNCGAPPAGDGKCVCDWRGKPSSKDR